MSNLEDIQVNSPYFNDGIPSFCLDLKDDGYLQNYEALERLKIERDLWTGISSLGGLLTLAPALLAPPLISLAALPNTGLTGLSLEYLGRVSRLYLTTKMLLDYFGDEGIKITPRVKTDFGVIDLLVKMPDKRLFALCLRSNGENFIRWREDRQAFYVYRAGKKGLKEWYPGTHVLKNFSQQTNWLRQTKSSLLGASSAERKKPIVRVLVLTGKTKLDRAHDDPSTRVQFGRAQVLKINAESSIYLCESQDLINFLLLNSSSQ
jgi:hypothetical protein